VEEIIFLLIIPIAIMLILLMLDFPIYIAILGPTIYLQVFVNDITLQKTFVTMVMGIMKPSILAVPFFVVAGNLISASGIGERLINFIMPKLRAIRGGVPLSSILANAFFGAISGSAPAAVATIGKLTFKPLVKYSGEQMALGVTASSDCIATIIPPSISLIFFGIATETSIGQLFMAGFFPGLVMVAIVGAYVIVATKSRPVFDEQIAKEGFLKILPVLLMPVVVLGGIYGGFFTPVEAGAVSAAYALVAAIFYRELTWEKLKFCLSIFVVQGVLEQPFEKISRAVVPFIAVYLVSLVIITFVPAISLWLPSMLR
jgi:C4-dicarboxylate transporter DctM subunit